MRQSFAKAPSRRVCGVALVVFLATISLPPYQVEVSHAQAQLQNGLTSNGTGIQTYENKNFDVKIRFTTEPNRPTMSNPTMLDFTVTHLDGSPIKNFVANLTEFTPSSNLTFASSQYYKFSPINVTNGTFSASYFFPSSGLYRLLLSIAPGGALIDAPFSVYVNNASYQTANDTAIYSGIVAAAVGGGIVFYLKSRKKQ